jgi:DNA polymerase-3 subunit epsilon
MGKRVRGVPVQAVQRWEQPDLLGLCVAPPAPAAGCPPETASQLNTVEASLTQPQGGRDAASLAAPTPNTAVKERVLAEAPCEGRVLPPLSLPGFTKTVARDAPRVLERLLILDTETTALTPDNGECIEVGAVLFHVSTRSVLTQVSFLLPCQANEAEAINGIPAAVSRLEHPWREALHCFLAMVAAADGILAHNAAFDRQWFGRGPLPALDKPWICSMDDITWPPERRLRAAPSVRDLAIAYGVPVWAAHRALTDCIYLVQVLERCGDLESLLRAACVPRRLYRAQLSYSERQQAKEAGFRWNDPVPGAWTKRLSEREAAALPFPVHPVPSA